MPIIYIDGKAVEAKPGQMIIEAAMDSGIVVPHYCWHPALSIAGNCRMCLVQVGSQKKDADGTLVFDDEGKPVISWIPKLQIACATPVADGMFVDMVGEKAVTAQNAVVEFQLINHPLDCPICDEAGQCKLQEYAFTHSNAKSRFDEEKVHKIKRLPFGPNVMFDGERCISCSRCIRFANEVAKQPALTFYQRGDSVSIRTFPGMQFDNAYSMNIIDICPVGALTSIDFRFRARVWEMSFTDTICPGCARGCNIHMGVMNNEVLRLEPRTNPHVNTYWMCDPGRLQTPDLINKNRLSGPQIRVNGELTPASWTDAIEAAVTIIRDTPASKVYVLGSSHASNEDNFVLAKLTREVLKSQNIDCIAHSNPEFADDMLRVADVSPNSAGARAVGIVPGNDSKSVHHLAKRITSGEIQTVIVLEDDALSHSQSLAEAFAALPNLIVLSAHTTVVAQQASVLLPIATFAEAEGTFTNINNRVQRFRPAVVTAENERYMGLKMSRWDKFGAPNDRWTHGERRDCRSAWRVMQAIAEGMGFKWGYDSSENVFNDIAAHVEGFKGMSYALLDKHMGLILNKADQPEPEQVIYVSNFMKPQVG
ncbi:MAG: NADH-quinone oxidoreductase subunit G [Chlorobi bacterium]|nr:MAG: molybdopterin-dependent oxidoreductase [Bacteroidota bacterium]KXK33850.1 MAG: NADH dehydrogenase I subunit G [Chlorobi bacterium OLB6]MBE2266024.1 (2Fe-2S)-binding protein [Flavobacteriales bacterium]MBL1161849.1 NADH-quinone oxidoreductase subunit G [Chlorobiota bacterium]MBW7854336.1 (2Fe-2S)-binding protein [Candidatus Kapabacteria bacterium]MCC6330667.1 (2Fe-2S)-binding protein [Ignavibacteria bacterium]